MARYLIRHPDAQPPIQRSPKKDGRLVERLVYELENGYASRFPMDSTWIEARRQYAGIPATAVVNQPIPNAPNIELPIGALVSDSLYAQVTDTLYQAMPILTAREMDAEWEPHAKAVQVLTNWMAANEIGLRFATDNSFQDDIQLGTGVLYCPWVKDEKVTNVAKVVTEEPRVVPISPEDFLVPGGSRGDHQQDEWMDIRFWYTPGEFRAQARQQKWEVGGAKPVAMKDRVRQQHELVAGASSAAPAHELYATENVWMYHDYDDDGIDRDLMVAFDRSSKTLLGVGYNRYDTRPVETMRFQIRPHLFWGLGVMEMGQPLQRAGTDTLNHFLLNMMLCNARMYIARHGVIDDFKRVWPMKIIGAESTDDIKELRMSDVYPSILAGLDRLIQLYERRVGVTGEFTSGSPASRVLGTRTPGITAMTALQSVNRRFAPAFDGMRLNTAAAVRQCLWRYAERVRANDNRVIEHLMRLLGDKQARLVFELFRQDDFERCVAVEFTAVSASVNREADRQNAALVMQTLGGYHAQIKETMAQLTMQPADPVMYDTAKKMMKAINYAMDAYLRTFDGVRNPDRLLINLDPELDQAKAGAAQAAQQESLLGDVLGAISGAGGQGGGPEGMPPAAPMGGEPA